MVSVGKLSAVVSPDLACEPEITDSAIFLLQCVDVQSVRINLFYNKGYGDMVISKSVVDKLMKLGRDVQLSKGPLNIQEVGNTIVVRCIYCLLNLMEREKCGPNWDLPRENYALFFHFGFGKNVRNFSVRIQY